jgi:HPt (histidine-containing phosphotransfer) domain-containing protein
MSKSKSDFLADLSQSSRSDCGRVNFNRQLFPQKVFSAIWDLESEVNNGGFCQYFVNNSSETAHFILEALKSVGAPRMVAICSKAFDAAFPNGLPSSPNEIQVAAKSGFSKEVKDKLQILDLEFFQYPDDLVELVFEFVKQHPSEFGDVPNFS